MFTSSILLSSTLIVRSNREIYESGQFHLELTSTAQRGSENYTHDANPIEASEFYDSLQFCRAA